MTKVAANIDNAFSSLSRPSTVQLHLISQIVIRRDQGGVAPMGRNAA